MYKYMSETNLQNVCFTGYIYIIYKRSKMAPKQTFQRLITLSILWVDAKLVLKLVPKRKIYNRMRGILKNEISYFICEIFFSICVKI